ncbi:MAG: hypothetical protein FWD27_00550 [Coriobacteriia bacterium]|nr:hypothetical protein [Coriobacteriia bacterium]
MSNKTSNEELGKLLAFVYLAEKGINIIEKSWSDGDLQVDAIIEEDKDLVFIQIRTS